MWLDAFLFIRYPNISYFLENGFYETTRLLNNKWPQLLTCILTSFIAERFIVRKTFYKRKFSEHIYDSRSIEFITLHVVKELLSTACYIKKLYPHEQDLNFQELTHFDPTNTISSLFWSMKKILDKHSTHSKNLEKQDQLSLDLNVSI